MNLIEVEDLLLKVGGFEFRPIPPGAAEAWWGLLRTTDPEDARQAVEEHYRMPGATLIRPADILGRVRVVRERREAAERAQKRELDTATPQCTPEVKEAALAQLRALARDNWSMEARLAKPDTATPTLPDSSITEDAKRQWSERLLAMANVA